MLWIVAKRLCRKDSEMLLTSSLPGPTWGGFRPQISYRPLACLPFFSERAAGSLLSYFEGHNKGGNGVANLRLKYRPRIGLVKKIFKDLRIKTKSCHKLL